MGIKEYLKYIQTESADVRNREYDYFYLDCNFLIHYLIYRCKNESDLYEKLFNYWENLNSIIKIKKEFRINKIPIQIIKIRQQFWGPVHKNR